MSELKLLIQIALRNLFSSFLNFVIGGIVLIGTMLFVVGGSVLNSVDKAMSRSITGSIAGHVQVYSDDSKDKLSLFSDWTQPDLTAIPDFSKIKGPVASVENVKAVIPMGVSGAAVTYGNTVDQGLEKLRKAITKRDGGDNSPELAARIESLTSHLKQMISVIQADYRKFEVMSSKDAVDPESVKALERAASPEFWAGFGKDPLNHLEFLENRVAYLVPDADYIYLAYMGTDLDAFRASFDRLQLVDGEFVPSGQRGMMLSKYGYEDQFKLKTARRLDKIHEALTEKGQLIAKEPDLQLMVKQNRTQTREILLQLDPMSSKKAVTGLQGFLNSQETELTKLLDAFFDTDDTSFAGRYEYFYKDIAPLVELYRLKPGDFITIKAFTKTGFLQSANLKIYGTFHFKGLEKSGLAGAKSLMDLMSFRDLYGYVTPEKIAETQKLKEATGVKFVDKDNAEAELFGGTSVVEQVKAKRIDDNAELGSQRAGAFSQERNNRAYTQEEIEGGVALSAAVILKDPSKLEATMQELEAVSKRDGLKLRVIDWQAAAGDLGQFVFIAKAVLYFAVFIIFIVALVIINNAVMMATLQRVREIGTMRAIGAQRGFVLKLVIVETLLLGLVFGLIGTFLGALLVKWFGLIGIPSINEFLYFFFSGPRLYVGLGIGSLIGAFVIISVVTSVSALYPAIVATRVSPLQAMQTED